MPFDQSFKSGTMSTDVIYNYFHSRGLRVLRESKSNNASPNSSSSRRDLRPPKPAPHEKNRKRGSSNAKDITCKSRGITKNKPRCPRKSVVGDSMTTFRNTTPEQIFPEPVVPLKYVAVNPLLSFQPIRPSISTPLEEEYLFNSTYAIECGVVDTYRSNLVYDRTSDSELRTLTITNWQDTTTSPSINGVFPSSETLLGDERQAIYRSFAGSLGPACGIQECVGTYKCHMQECSRIYYETLTNYHSVDPPDKHTISAVQIPISSVNEFQSWFPSGEIHRCERRYRDSCNKPDLQRLVSKEEIGLLDHIAWPGNVFGETLDDLFPALSQELPIDACDVTESPVLRSRMRPSGTFYFLFLPEASCDGTEEAKQHNTPSQVSSEPVMFPEPPKLAKRKIPRPRNDSRGPVRVGHLLEADISAGRPSLTTEQRFIVPCADSIAFSGGDHDTRRPRRASARPLLSAGSPYKSLPREMDSIQTKSTASRGTRRRMNAAGGSI